MVTLNVFLFTLLGVFGLMCIAVAVEAIKDVGVSDIIVTIFTSVIGLAGLSAVILAPMCILYGLTHEVDIHMQNSEGKIIERTVKVFEYSHHGNCFSFYDDKNHYCGWEVRYNHKD